MDLSNLPTNRPPSHGTRSRQSFVEFVIIQSPGGTLLAHINEAIEKHADTHLLSSFEVRDHRTAYLHFISRESEELLLAKLTAMEAQLSTLVELLQKSL